MSYRTKAAILLDKSELVSLNGYWYRTVKGSGLKLGDIVQHTNSTVRVSATMPIGLADPETNYKFMTQEDSDLLNQEELKLMVKMEEFDAQLNYKKLFDKYGDLIA